MFYTNPVCPHVPGGIELLKKQVKGSLLFVDALVGNPIMVDLLSALPVDAFIIDWRLNVVVDARTGFIGKRNFYFRDIDIVIGREVPVVIVATIVVDVFVVGACIANELC